VFQVDLHILPLAGCDVVLGTQWLRILCHILGNFVSLTMEFQYSKTKSVLQGLQQVPQVSLEDANAFKLSNKRKRYDTLPPQYITPDHLCPRDKFYF
jgi:hypothetical protein